MIQHPHKKFKQVVIWGYELHKHTHSYIHAAFKKAFEHLGYTTYWFRNDDHPADFDYTNTLFFTSSSNEGHDAQIPLNPTCTYITHNVDVQRYLAMGCKVLMMQVYSTDVMKYFDPQTYQFINDYTILVKAPGADCMYMPWATDILPHEINLDNATNKLPGEANNCVWIGTYGAGNHEQEIGSELRPFFAECSKMAIEIQRVDPWANPISFDENYAMVKNAYLAPAIQSRWQRDRHYVPCRLFKNISYCQMGITNNPFCNKIFDGAVLYDQDPVALFHKAIEFKRTPTALDTIKHLMHEVRTKHTYINRINDLMNALPE